MWWWLLMAIFVVSGVFNFFLERKKRKIQKAIDDARQTQFDAIQRALEIHGESIQTLQNIILHQLKQNE